MNSPSSLEDRLAALRVTPELAGWSERSLQTLLPYFDEVAPAAGRQLAVEGRPSAQFLIVLEGVLEARSHSGDLRLLEAGASFGWRGMWDRGPNEATVKVREDARLLVMGHAQFRAVKGEASGRAA